MFFFKCFYYKNDEKVNEQENMLEQFSFFTRVRDYIKLTEIGRFFGAPNEENNDFGASLYCIDLLQNSEILIRL